MHDVEEEDEQITPIILVSFNFDRSLEVIESFINADPQKETQERRQILREFMIDLHNQRYEFSHFVGQS